MVFAVEKQAVCRGKVGTTEKYLFLQCVMGNKGPMHGLSYARRKPLLAELLYVCDWAVILVFLLCRNKT